MAFKQDFLDLGKGKLTQAKAYLEELEVQMALGKAEARDAFQREKKNLTSFLNKQKTQFKETEDIADEHRAALLQSLEVLESQLGLELPGGKRDFDKQKKETLEKIYQLEYNLREAFGDVSHSLQDQLNDFKIKLDTYRVQLALGSYDNEEELTNRKNELQQTVDKLRLKLQKEATNEDRMENFTKEVSESFDHMKKAFSDLFA